MEEQVQPKLIFGLSPLATIINAFFILAVPPLAWLIKISTMFPTLKELEAGGNVGSFDILPWYWTYPFIILGICMVQRWIDYKFGKMEFGMKYIFYRYVLFIMALTVYQMLIQFVGVIILFA